MPAEATREGSPLPLGGFDDVRSRCLGPCLPERLPIENPEKEADEDEDGLIERPGNRQQTEGDEAS